MEESGKKDPVLTQCPDCSQSLDVSAFAPFSKIDCPHCGASVRVRTVMEKYHITGLLGAGGMSQVFRAVDMHLGREVALKILHQSLSRDSALTAMFEREAKLTASILHPNVVKVYTVGNDQGYFFIAMELVDATSLEDLIANKGALSESDVLHIAHDVTSGLKAAYEESLIHRDIKPGNMLVTGDGTAKLVDFGLAVQQGGEDESEELWATPFYVPPEKLEGESDTYLGDIYSLGATLYHALAGKPPFEANTSSMEDLKVIKKDQVDLKSVAPGVSKPTVKLIERMMAYAPENRHQDYDEILAEVEEIEKRQFGIHRSTRGPKSDKRTAAIVLGTFSALVAVAVGVYIKLKQDEIQASQSGFGIGTGERVISAGDNNNTEKFLQGRDLISEGKFKRAESIFDELVFETSPSPATRMWTLYFQGICRLWLGDEINARKSFGLIGAIDYEGEVGAAKVMASLEKIALPLSEPLPVLNAEARFQEETLRPVWLLAAGLKNWQHGQLESGIELLDAFKESTPPQGMAWLKSLKKSVEVFRQDYAKLKGAPNPSRVATRELGEQRKALESVLTTLETKGAAPALMKSRTDRIDRITALIAEEKARKKQVTPPKPDKPVVRPKGNKSSSGKGKGDVLSDEEKQERVRLRELLTSLQSYGDTLLFSGAVSKLQTESFSTEMGQVWHQDLIAGFERADEFVGVLAQKLKSGSYEGTIRRRQGVALDAMITDADESRFVVDLGFGPNEVDVGVFAPDWLVEAAGEVLPEMSPENAEEWQRVVFFALATGQGEEAQRLAGKLAPFSPEFAERWKRLMRLRRPAD